MDTDWCLTCNRHIDASVSSPYCSLDCRCMAGPSRLPEYSQSAYEDSFDGSDDVVYHDVEDAPACHYTGNDYNGISAWAAAVVPGAPVHEISRPPSTRSTSSSRSSISNFSHKSLSTVTCRPPDLLRPHRPLPPALCMSSTKPTRSKPSQPIGTAQPTTKSTASAAYSTSTGQTESSLATPASANAMPFSNETGGVFDCLRSWVTPSPYASTPHSPVDFTPVRYLSKPEPKSKQLSSPHDLSSFNARGRKSSRAKA